MSSVTTMNASEAVEVDPKRAKAPKRAYLVLAGLVLGGSLVWGVHAFLTWGEVETDDAQIDADVVPISARASGQVARIVVRDNQHVHAGQVILELDTAELRAKMDKAQAELATVSAQAREADANVQLVIASASGGLKSARASVLGAQDAVRSASAQVSIAQASLDRARAQATLAVAEFSRAQGLFQSRAVSQAEMDRAQAGRDAAAAAVVQAQASLANALAARSQASSVIAQAEGHLEQSAPIDIQLAAARARADLAHAKVQEAQAAVRLAELDLSYAVIRAQTEGTVSRLAVREGQLVSAGQVVVQLIPKRIYVVANFKETQIRDVRPGQRVQVRVDAVRKTFEGVVQSVAAGTGARFSLLPPDNASGNFVKVVQRVPVRIEFKAGPPDLQAGLSCDVTVHVR